MLRSAYVASTAPGSPRSGAFDAEESDPRAINLKRVTVDDARRADELGGRGGSGDSHH